MSTNTKTEELRALPGDIRITEADWYAMELFHYMLKEDASMAQLRCDYFTMLMNFIAERAEKAQAEEDKDAA